MELERTLPVSKKIIKWGLSKVGSAFDLAPVYSSPANRHLLDVALAMSRVTHFDGLPRDQFKMDMMSTVREWEELDLEFFLGEVSKADAERRQAFGMEQPPTPENVRAARDGALKAAAQMLEAVTHLANLSTALEASQGPLGKT